ncbi:carboxylate--amine ligase [Alteromonas aestuariivivens]|uniref:Carboxylate--amine ligase n=1 Tax=Alteromonas aestuariivivens TaxID=1938339 RepID=A0A3D8M3H8_9ALTE|nr:RimK family protein [Alteromonas aestuariivivens]RDV24249.1 carboxylate--amine ligase [Alteromonas aestuariivivens]
MHRTLIVTDDTQLHVDTDLQVLTFEQYLADFPKLNEPKTRVINLCDTGKYLSQGYYCSLLAQARKHKVLPSVNVINDLRASEKGERARIPLPKTFRWPEQKNPSQTFYVLFGQTREPALMPIASMAFRHYPCPIMRVTLHIGAEYGAEAVSKSGHKMGYVECEAIGYAQLPVELRADCVTHLQGFTQSHWTQARQSKRTRWDMAILVNPHEATPPSDDKAIRNFVKAAEKVGISAQVLSELTADDVGHFDALFIRETTAIDHHTYRLARAAEREGLVVMDDTQSILRCCNKVFLQDAFTYQKVPAPKSQMVSSAESSVCQQLVDELGLPLVLKLPESSFSRGVFKVETIEDLQVRLTDMLSASALVLVQEYVYTEYDWRIGVLGGKPIYACQYFMARNHWQIYHHEGDGFSSGDFKTLPTFEVPRPVLHAAVKAAKVVGNGLYGVDIKQSGNKVYVIEVNDNPSIESGVEDEYLGKELYQLIMQEFADRLELRGR